MVFDDALGILERATESFRICVRDEFGESIIREILDPIRDQIRLLCSLHEDSERSSLQIDQILRDARLINSD
jgi:hypothetical protein